jgi:hypothetical protein
MPCRDYATDDIWMHGDTEKRELKERLDKVTRLLCFVMDNIDDHQGYGTRLLETDSDVQKELESWWEEHKQKDEEERLRQLKEFSKHHRQFLLKEKLRKEFSDEEIEELKALLKD